MPCTTSPTLSALPCRCSTGLRKRATRTAFSSWLQRPRSPSLVTAFPSWPLLRPTSTGTWDTQQSARLALTRSINCVMRSTCVTLRGSASSCAPIVRSLPRSSLSLMRSSLIVWADVVSHPGLTRLVVTSSPSTLWTVPRHELLPWPRKLVSR